MTNHASLVLDAGDTINATGGITTDTGDAAWLLAEGGYVVPVGDTAALAAALRQAYATGGAALASPRARVEQVFSAGNLLTNTESALRAVQPKGN